MDTPDPLWKMTPDGKLVWAGEAELALEYCAVAYKGKGKDKHRHFVKIDLCMYAADQIWTFSGENGKEGELSVQMDGKNFCLDLPDGGNPDRVLAVECGDEHPDTQQWSYMPAAVMMM